MWPALGALLAGRGNVDLMRGVEERAAEHLQPTVTSRDISVLGGPMQPGLGSQCHPKPAS